MGFLQNQTGVADGARTHDNRNHNPGLYQLSYSHQRCILYIQSLKKIKFWSQNQIDYRTAIGLEAVILTFKPDFKCS
jgi:hypothetical protein